MEVMACETERSRKKDRGYKDNIMKIAERAKLSNNV
jgi:hypothetical protein